MWILRASIDEQELVFRLSPGTGRTLGRAAQADFVVGHALVSRVHCRLTATENDLVVEDLKSTNGTFVNETRVESATLEHGDCVRVGHVEFSVSRKASEEAEEAGRRPRGAGEGRKRPVDGPEAPEEVEEAG